MKSILQINASLNSGNGESSRLANAFAARLRAQHPGANLVLRDLARDPVPHLDAERFGAFLAKPESRTPAQRAVVDYSDALVRELQQADVIVIGLPMYNFGVPSQLKAWIDHVARAGVTFKYAEKGAVGLLTGKKAWVFATRGGRYAGTAADAETPFLRQFLAFVGITDVEFVHAEGLALGEAAKNDSLAAARDAILRLVPELEFAA
jgi:FMN-dependent NADH-azoreductase